MGRQASRLAERAGELLLLGAVVFWWGGYVIPQLLALGFPAVISSEALPLHLNPEYEETFANIVSAMALSTLAILALVNAVVAHRKSAGRIAIGGWTATALTAASVAFEEVSDFHITGLTALERSVFGPELVDALGTSIWVLLLSPLIIVFVFAFGGFVFKGLPAQIRAPFILGIVAWLLATVHEVSYSLFFLDKADTLAIVTEETLEFSGTLLIGLGAVVALRSRVWPRLTSSPFRGQRSFLPAAGAMTVVAILGSLSVAFLFRVPVVDARADHIDTFELTLRDKEAVIQEFRMPAYPLASQPPAKGIVAVRVTEAGSEAIVAEGFVEVPVENRPVWRDIKLFPQLAKPEGAKVAVWVAADIGRDAELKLGATQTDRYEYGRLWVNGALTWPDQDLEFVAYGAPEPTRSKFRAIWDLLMSDWRWPVLAMDLIVAITLVALIPTLLVTAALTLRNSSS